jgi:hypothetical protein
MDVAERTLALDGVLIEAPRGDRGDGQVPPGSTHQVRRVSRSGPCCGCGSCAPQFANLCHTCKGVSLPPHAARSASLKTMIGNPVCGGVKLAEARLGFWFLPPSAR